MSAGCWELEFAEARQRLHESGYVQVLRGRGHDLVDGVVLTSVSDVPFEVSLKCKICGAVFWFENTEWATGGIAKWRIGTISTLDASSICLGAGTAYQSQH